MTCLNRIRDLSTSDIINALPDLSELCVRHGEPPNTIAESLPKPERLLPVYKQSTNTSKYENLCIRR